MDEGAGSMSPAGALMCSPAPGDAAADIFAVVLEVDEEELLVLRYSRRVLHMSALLGLGSSSVTASTPTGM